MVKQRVTSGFHGLLFAALPYFYLIERRGQADMKIILASQSPRRREILQLMNLPFEVKVSDIEERITSTNPARVTEELSCQKAEAVAKTVEEGIIIGADTVVSLDDKILGKPADKEQARKMIQGLQGRSHKVYTGVTVIEKREGDEISRNIFSEETTVKVAPMSKQEVEDYISLEEPYDKAGAYGIQGTFAKYIEGIEGDYFNVVGLPLHRLYEQLKA